MTNTTFTTIDGYIDNLFVVEDEPLKACETRMAEAGLPAIQVSPGQGKFLYLMAKLANAKRILEIGTLGGYSTIWLARALPDDGQLITMEYDPHHATVAQENIKSADLDGKVDILVGEALGLLPEIETAGGPPIDLVFLDADKINYVAYLEWSLRLLRPGGLLLADNVIREGAVIDPDESDPSALGAARFNAVLAAEPKLESIVLQQVGLKGHDGIAIARVVNEA